MLRACSRFIMTLIAFSPKIALHIFGFKIRETFGLTDSLRFLSMNIVIETYSVGTMIREIYIKYNNFYFTSPFIVHV